MRVKEFSGWDDDQTRCTAGSVGVFDRADGSSHGVGAADLAGRIESDASSSTTGVESCSNLRLPIGQLSSLSIQHKHEHKNSC